LKRWTKILLALVILVVLAIASIPLFVNANTFRPEIEKQLTAALGRSVKLGGLSLSIFSGNLVAKELSIADDPTFSTQPFLTAKELRIGVLLRPLIFSHQLNLRSFEIESPQIALIRGANGAWNFSSIGHQAQSSRASLNPTSGNSSSSKPGLPALSASLVAIRDGRAVIANLPRQSEPSVYDDVNLTARDFSLASPFAFDLSANIPGGGIVGVTGRAGPINRDNAAATPGDARIVVKGLDAVAAGFLDPNAGASFLADIDTHAASDGQTLITSGTAHLQNLKLRKGANAAPKPLDLSYSGSRRLKDGTGEIEDATAKIGNAAIHASGTYSPVSPGSADLLLNLRISGQGLPVDDLQPLLIAAAIRLPNGSVLRGGTLSMNLAINGHANSLVIVGPVALDNTRLVGFDIGSKIHGIASMSGLKTGNETYFEKLRVNLRITNAVVVADRIDAVIPAVGELTGSGTVSPANQLDFNLMAKVTSAKGIGKIGVGLLSKLSGSSGKTSGVPMRVTGTSDDPYITADVARSFSSIFGKSK
jgi:AsmA protein